MFLKMSSVVPEEVDWWTWDNPRCSPAAVAICWRLLALNSWHSNNRAGTTIATWRLLCSIRHWTFWYWRRSNATSAEAKQSIAKRTCKRPRNSSKGVFGHSPFGGGGCHNSIRPTGQAPLEIQRLPVKRAAANIACNGSSNAICHAIIISRPGLTSVIISWSLSLACSRAVQTCPSSLRPSCSQRHLPATFRF